VPVQAKAIATQTSPPDNSSGKANSPVVTDFQNEKAPLRGLLTLAHPGDPSPVTWITFTVSMFCARCKHLLSLQAPYHPFAPFAYLACFAVSDLSYAH